MVLAADTLEHVRDPKRLLNDAAGVLAPRGTVTTSVPNVRHWYPRAPIALGRFDYDQRGILDEGHVRFFTRASFERLVTRANFAVRRRKRSACWSRPTGSADEREHTNVFGKAERVALAASPSMSGFQFFYEVEPRGR